MDQHFQLTGDSQLGDSELAHDNVIQFARKYTRCFYGRWSCNYKHKSMHKLIILIINVARFIQGDKSYAIKYNSWLIKYNLFKKLNKINYINYF